MVLAADLFGDIDGAVLPDFLATAMQPATCRAGGHGRPTIIGSAPVLPFLEDCDGRRIDLAGYGLGRPLVLLFHCGKACARCGRLLAALRAASPDLRLAGARTVVIVPRLTEPSLPELEPEMLVLIDSQSWFARELGFADGSDSVAVLDGMGVIRWAARGGQVAIRDISAEVRRAMPLGHRA